MPPATSDTSSQQLSPVCFVFACCVTGQGHVDATSEFAVLVQYKLGAHSILMAAEVDAMKEEGDGPEEGRPYVELKTYRWGETDRQLSGSLCRKCDTLCGCKQRATLYCIIACNFFQTSVFYELHSLFDADQADTWPLSCSVCFVVQDCWSQ